MSRGCVMFSANWVSGSPHRFTSYIYCDVHTEKHWHCRGVPTALLLTQPRPVCGLCACPVPAYRDSLCLVPLCSLKARVVSGLEASIPSSSRATTKKEWKYVSRTRNHYGVNGISGESLEKFYFIVVSQCIFIEIF